MTLADFSVNISQQSET